MRPSKKTSSFRFPPSSTVRPPPPADPSRLNLPPAGRVHPSFRRLVLALLLPAVSLNGCIRNPATRKLQTRLISGAAEKRIGEETKKQMLEQFREITGTPLNEYVTELGNRLAEGGDRPRLGYNFTVLDTDLINAFAVPGGYIFVTRGLLEQVKDESELAGVLAHEIGHVTGYHGVQMIQKEMGYGVLTTLGAIAAATQLGPEALEIIARSANLFTTLYLLGYTREKELEADRLGLRYMVRAGYSPEGLLRFFRKLQSFEGPDQKEVKGWDLYFRTHPPTGERIRLVQRYMPRPSTATRPGPGEAGRFAEVMASLPRESRGREGIVEGLDYRHPTLGARLTLPKGWSFESIHPRYLVDFSSPGGSLRGHLRRDLVEPFTKPEDYAARLGKEMGFKLLGGQSVLYPCGYAFLGRYVGQDLLGGLSLVRVLATIRDREGYAVICFLPGEEFDRYLLVAEQVMRSFKLDAE